MPTRQAILDAAFAFKQAGGTVIVVAPRASGVLQGFDLAERIATGGFFINASDSTSADTLLQLNYLKKLLCAGSCVDPGDRHENLPAMDYATFVNWEIVEGSVNLLGPGLRDFLPGNGLYIELSGQSHTVIRTIDTFDVVAGQTYLISFKAAGNQQSEASQSITVSLRVGDTKVFEQTVFPAWNDVFQTYNFNFTAAFDAPVRIYFEQNYAGTIVPGTMLDDILFKNGGTTLLEDNFDDENLTYIPPACGESGALDEVADPDAPVVAPETTGGAAAPLPFTEAYVYSLTAVTNEGETAEVLCSVDPEPPSADEAGDVNRITWAAASSPRIVAWRLWRSLGEDLSGWSGPTAPRYLLAQLPANQTTYIDSEHIAEFTARYESSVTAPTVNTTAVAAGGLGYGYASCCDYYSVSGTEEGDLIVPGEPGGPPANATVTDESNGGSDPTIGVWLICDGDLGTLWAGNVSVDPAWVKFEFANAKLIQEYRITPDLDTNPAAWTAPQAWVLEGSNNDSDWTEIDSQSGVGGWAHLVAQSFSVSPVDSYKFFRFTFTETTDALVPEVGIAELQFTGNPDVLEFVNNCPECLKEVPGTQVADPTPLADIESGFNPPVIYSSTKSVDVGCPVGFANAPTANIVPVMTSASAPSGTVISSAGEAVGFEAWRVFDDDPDTYMDLVGTITGYVGYLNTVTKIATSYRLTARSDYTLGTPKAWTFEGSNDGSTWDVLDTRSNIMWFAGQTQTFSFPNSTSYLYYRLNVSTNVSGDASSNLSLAGLEIFGASAATAHGEATATSSISQQDADTKATAAATAAAQAQLNCVVVFTSTQSAQSTPCPIGSYGGPPVTKSATATSYNSQAEADALATAAAQALADEGRDCLQSNNTSGVTIGDLANGVPYPSVSYIAAAGVITNVQVNLNGLTHPTPDDLRILLVSPSGTGVWLMKDCGGTNGLSNVNLVFDDTGGALPDSTQITSGTYAPTIFGGNQLPNPPAPQNLPSLTLAAFAGEDRQGSWALYISDDLVVGAGSVASWSLIIS